MQKNKKKIRKIVFEKSEKLNNIFLNLIFKFKHRIKNISI